MKRQKININKLLCRLDDKFIEKVFAINTKEKYQEQVKMIKKKGKVDIVKGINDLMPL